MKGSDLMITEIEAKIKQLNGGQFQKLIQCYVSAEYGKLSSPGAQQGTNNTTPGTPDSYIVNENGDYIFVEYTVQQTSVYKKIDDDIVKCLAESVNKSINLVKILYFHTSHPLSTANDAKLRKKCKDSNCDLEIYNISMLSLELYKKHNNIIRDELGIPIDSGLIMKLEEFIEHNDLQRTSTPLGVDIIGREDEITKVVSNMNNNDVVLLFGKAGIGKTRLALEACREFLKQNDSYEIYCLKKNDLKLYDEIKRYFDKEGNFLVFIDDANQITSFKYLLDYIGTRRERNLKIIATVRDYAKEKVINEITIIENISLELYKIKKLDNDSIKAIAKNNFGIKNSRYIDRIVQIAQGNARLASIASKIAIDNNTIESINDATQLVEKYYEGIIEESCICKEDLIIVACMYMLDGIYFEDEKTMNSLTKLTNLTMDTYKSRALELHRNEIINFCEDVAIKPADQILSCYLAYCALYKYKHISIASLLDCFFDDRNTTIINGLNGISNYFRYDDIYEYLKEQVNISWNKVNQEDSNLNIKYLRAFHMFNPDETLLLISQKIKATNPIHYQGDYEIPNNYSGTLEIELELLGNYANTLEYLTALELVFQYAEKRQDKYDDIFYILTNSSTYGINGNSDLNEYQQQLQIMIKALERTKNWEDVFFTNLYIKLAGHYLNIGYEFTDSSGRRSFVFGETTLNLCDGSKKLRQQLWNSLLEILELKKYNASLLKILSGYILHYKYNLDGNEKEIAQFDAPYIFALADKLDFDIFEEVSVYYDLLTKLSRHDIDVSSEISRCKSNAAFDLYYWLLGEKYRDLDYEKQEEAIEQDIMERISDYDSVHFIKLIEVRDQIVFNNSELNHNRYDINESVHKILSYAFEKKDINYFDIISKLLYDCNYTNYSYIALFEKALNVIDADEIEKLVLDVAINEKLFIVQNYLLALSQRSSLEKKHLDILIDYYDNEIASNNTYVFNLKILENFVEFDENIYVKILNKILESEKDKDKSRIYMFSIFGYHDNPSIFIKYFKCNFNTLKQLYYKMILHHNHDDYKNKYLKCMIEMGIIELEEYLELSLSQDSFTLNETIASRLVCLWELENYKEMINFAVSYILDFENEDIHSYKRIALIKTIFAPQPNNAFLKEQNNWIDEFIKVNYQDNTIMIKIFKLICEFSEKRRLHHISNLIMLNNDFELFKEIRLEPTSSGWSGSELPIIDKKIKYLSRMLDILSGVDFLEHRNYISSKIERTKKYRKSRKIDEFLRDY